MCKLVTSMTDEDLIRLAVVSPADLSRPPHRTDALPRGVSVTEIYEAMVRAGGEAYDGFPTRTDPITTQSLARLSEIAAALLSES